MAIEKKKSEGIKACLKQLGFAAEIMGDENEVHAECNDISLRPYQMQRIAEASNGHTISIFPVDEKSIKIVIW